MTAGLPGCTGLTSGDSDPVVIEIINPPPAIGVNDTVTIRMRALNRNGDSIPDAPVRLISENPDTLGITADSTAIIGRIPGPGRFLAAVGNLNSQTFTTTVTAP